MFIDVKLYKIHLPITILRLIGLLTFSYIIIRWRLTGGKFRFMPITRITARRSSAIAAITLSAKTIP